MSAACSCHHGKIKWLVRNSIPTGSRQSGRVLTANVLRVVTAGV